ncbi:MAG: ATP-binding protein [Candidatus Omnitrophica bacterium]|nr:ATP-binding protein [Candidatus Omnitrophota bacterium]
MEKSKLQELIIIHKEKFLSRKGLIRRAIQKKTSNHIKSKEIVLITGVRRSGKSSLMKLIADDVISEYKLPVSNLLYLNFEDERFIDFNFNDFEPLYETFLGTEKPQGKKFLFLDEIQNIKGWEKWVNRLYEYEDIKVFITGSNATLLSSEISSALTGRNRQVILWPFSFNEYLLLKNFSVDDRDLFTTEKKVSIKSMFKEYLSLGGFPEVVKQKDATLLEQYFKDIIYRDLLARYSIRKIKEFKELCLYLISNTGTICSYENLRIFIGANNVTTIKNYFDYLENVFLFFRVPLFDYSIKKQIYNPGKFYAIDTGLIKNIGFKFSENPGHIYENMVFLALKRRNADFYYWKSKKNREVDFVIREGLKIKEVIQVCYDMHNKKTKEREIKSLLAAKNELEASHFTIITEDEEGEERIDSIKIRIIPLWKWSLER